MGVGWMPLVRREGSTWAGGDPGWLEGREKKRVHTCSSGLAAQRSLPVRPLGARHTSLGCTKHSGAAPTRAVLFSRAPG